MPIFGPPNVERMARKGDLKGLIKAVAYQKDYWYTPSTREPFLEEDVRRVAAIRAQAAQTLGEMGDKQGVDALIEALSDHDLGVRCSAARALGKIGDRRALPALMSALNAGHAELRNAASDTLVAFGSASVELLINALIFQNREARQIAAKLLGRISDERVIVPLINCLRDEDSAVRESIAKALVNHGTLSIEPLTRVLNDKDKDFSTSAAAILNNLNWLPTNDALGARYYVLIKQWDQCAKLGSAAVDPLIEALKDEDPVVRNAAIQTLIKIGVPAEEPMIAALKNRHKCIRESAAIVLQSISGSRSVPHLVDALQDKAEDVRLAAARALAEIGDEQTIQTFIALLEDQNKELANLAGRTLVDLAPASLDLLVAAFADGNESLQLATAEILRTLQWTPSQDALGLKYWIITGQWDQCVPMGERAVEALSALLKDQDPAVRASAAKTLVKIGLPAVEPFADALRTGDDDLRLLAARSLGKIRAEATEDALLTALYDENKTVRHAAATALENLGWKPGEDAISLQYLLVRERWEQTQQFGSLGAERLIKGFMTIPTNAHQAVLEVLVGFGSAAVEPLIKALNDKDIDTQKTTIIALKKIGDERAVTPLIDLLKHENSEIRLHTAETLGQIGNSRAIKPLIACLEDPDRNVRNMSAEALVNLGEDDVYVLIAALKDIDKENRKNAAITLGNRGDIRGVPPLIDLVKYGTSDIRQPAASALGKIGDARAVHPLITALGDEDVTVRKAAAGALGQIGDPRAIEPLIAILKDEVKSVRLVATQSLGKINDPRAVEALIVALQHSYVEVRIEAAKALGQIADPIAVEPLINALEYDDSNVRQSAAQALIMIKDGRATKRLIGLLDDNDYWRRQAAAEVLVGFFHAGVLTQTQKQLVLKLRDRITQKHMDQKFPHQDSWGPRDCHHDRPSSHEDNMGIGISFPV